MSNTVVCSVCGFPAVPVKEGKGGSWSGKCPGPKCGAQLLVRSPDGAETLKARLSGAASQAAPAAAVKKSGGIDFLED